MHSVFESEADFEEAVIKALLTHGWGKKAANEPENILRYPTEQDLINNWADCLYFANMGAESLNGQRLTESEMGQILDQVARLQSPVALNDFINGKTITIVRDNPKDERHFGHPISLKIYDRNEIAAGHSTYQIAQQPHLRRKDNDLSPDGRGDLMLLINGMPVIHIELKRSGVSVTEACNQIEKYRARGCFKGIYSLLQVFVAMTPEETLYFANTGNSEFKKCFQFHWGDFNNEPINQWNRVIEELLSIPMAHQLVGFYTVADKDSNVLKVMRSYQFYAASRISDYVSKIDWNDRAHHGGYIWHTTGSGKTMTSFKAAQLIANSGNADKVVFLVDRTELETQSNTAYKSFCSAGESIGSTDNTFELVKRLKETKNAKENTLIVTSIQKMSNVKEGGFVTRADLDAIREKRIVFIVDECHRDTAGQMMADITTTFPFAAFFGFTGTPILEDENNPGLITTNMIFGDELHRYSIADGIRDKNVLGFDPHKMSAFNDVKLREAVALQEAKAESMDEIKGDAKKEAVYYYYIETAPMAGYRDSAGGTIKGIEDFVKEAQYDTDEYRNVVVDDILLRWRNVSHNYKFSALLATHSIPEAMAYYRIFKERNCELNVTAIFDTSLDNKNNNEFLKEQSLCEIIEDYNTKFFNSPRFDIASYSSFKADVASRLAHKDAYKNIDSEHHDYQLDLVIVVNQLLTGYDSVWLNALYLDKMLDHKNIIQAFSRTNRLFGPDKPFGTIRYYRRPHTMQKRIHEALKMYAGEHEAALFANKLYQNLDAMNRVSGEIESLFKTQGINDFSRLPESQVAQAKFRKLFSEFEGYLNAAKIQGFMWEDYEKDPAAYTDMVHHSVPTGNEEMKATYHLLGLDEEAHEDGDMVLYEIAPYTFSRDYYRAWIPRNKEAKGNRPPQNIVPGSCGFDIDPYLVEMDNTKIDSDYMNENFDKWLKALSVGDVSAEQILQELHNNFAYLSRVDQDFAENVLLDIKSGDLVVQEGLSFIDYINRYKMSAENEQIKELAAAFGLRSSVLPVLSDLLVTKNTDQVAMKPILDAVDKEMAARYFKEELGEELPPFRVTMRVREFVKKFITQGGYYLYQDDEAK